MSMFLILVITPHDSKVELGLRATVIQCCGVGGGWGKDRILCTLIFLKCDLGSTASVSSENILEM